MPLPATDFLTLIRDLLLLLQEESLILASPEEAAYFRKTYTAPALSKPRPIQPKKETPTREKETRAPIPPPAISQPQPPQLAEQAGAPQRSSLRSLFSIIAPEMALAEKPPSDAMARKIATRWKTKNQTAPITLLSLSEPPEQKNLLEEIAKALDIYYGPARLIDAESIEKEKQWDAFLSVADLKWIITCDYTLWQLSSLMQHYKENPAQGTRSLKNVPLFLLPDLSLYLKDPLLKRSLWKGLCIKRPL